jgi:ornithine cyclodeaminase
MSERAGPRIVTGPEIEQALAAVDVVTEIEAGFVAYSQGRCVIPPVGELIFDDPPGEVHLKYGYIRGDEYYVVKIASGFYDNPRLGLPSGDGVMLLFRQETGELVAVLLDRGRLTDVRTAAAGAVAARHLAPPEVRRVGILGTGTQARLQLLYLRGVVDCERVLVCGRRKEALDDYRRALESSGFSVETTERPEQLGARCELIVTTTPATGPLLRPEWIRPGTHVTAVGSDTVAKQELDARILEQADVVVGDSIAQCRERGEIAQALACGAIDEGRVVELGAVVTGDAPGRTAASQVTVADLTGVAVQDLQIAKAVYRGLERDRP